MKQFNWKKLLPYLVALVLFIGFALLYCSPILEGKIVYAGDTNSWYGAAHQIQEYNAQTGEESFWTGSMFCGMPSYQIVSYIPSHSLAKSLRDGFHLAFNETFGLIFGYLTCFFILLLCYGVNPWLSLIGAVAMTLSSYFFLIIPAGHVTKAMALGLLPAIMGGVHLVFCKKYWCGIPIMLFFGVTSITLHPQMTYYIAMLIGILSFAELYIHLREKRWKDLGIAVGICLVCLALIAMTKICYFRMNNEYLAETMRGGHSELTRPDEDKSKPAGLDIDYATAWSYGKAETFTFLIPNFMGGASGYNVGDKSVLFEELVQARVPRNSAKQFCQQAPTYWGEKAFTSGPVYVGAIVCFLFILGLLIVSGPYKWALLIATLFSVFLAWGRNFMPLTQFFYDYFPMYNKFRAVESILVVAEITMPLLGFLALKRISESDDKRSFLRPTCIAAGITAGLCLLFALFGGSLFDFTSSYDAQWKNQVGDSIYQMILDQRASMLTSDAWRSFFFIAGAFLTLFFFLSSKLKPAYFYTLLGLLVLLDMMPVDRRFFGTKDFVSQRDNDRFFAMQPWEEQILQDDQSLDYRVLNTAANTFNDARTSYRLKSIGGYSAVKLRRYQDLIDAHISRNNWNVLNMLNTKYIVARDGSVHQNPEAFGNCWFVDSLLCVNTPDAESEALNTLDLRHVAVMDTTFAPNHTFGRDWCADRYRSFPTADRQPTDSQSRDVATIALTSYAPNKLVYEAQTDSAQLAVFSEIYYPHGWHLYIDGEESPLYRVNYTLRAALIPQGKHELRMEFVPDALQTDKWGYVCLIFSLIISLVCLGYAIYQKERANVIAS